VGLTLAIALRRHGVRCRVVDKNDGPSELCKALAVQARTLEIFAHLGIAQAALEGGLILHGACIYRDGVLVHRNQIDPTPRPEVPYPFVLSLEQGKTETILANHLVTAGGRLDRRIEVVGFIQDGAGVTVQLRHPSGQEESTTAKYLVGCDGAHSTVREALGLPFEGDDYPHAFLLADVDISWPLANNESHRFMHQEQALVAWPIDGRGRFYLSGPESHAYHNDVHSSEWEPLESPTLAEVQAYVDKRLPVNARLSNPRWLSRYRVSKRIVSRYRVGRVFLVGDAAHVHSTTGAQGMNTGIQDAYNLAWKLALVLKGQADPEILDTYHAERHRIGQSVLETSDHAFRQWTGTQRVKLDDQEATRQMFAKFAQLDLNYRGSPIVEDYPINGAGEPAALQAGDRAPDGILVDPAGRRCRLFEVIASPRHHLLLFTGVKSDSSTVSELNDLAEQVRAGWGERVVTHWIAHEEAPLEPLATWSAGILVDPTGRLHATYGAVAPAAYLIRPDGHIGFYGGRRHFNKLPHALGRVLTPQR